MKTDIQNFAMLAAVAVFASCNTANGEMKPESASEKKVLHAHQPRKIATHANILSGTIQLIEKEKDGFAAQLRTDEGDIYYVIVNRNSMITPSQYREFKTGESVTVVGDHWEAKGVKHLTVHIIQ